LEKVLRTTLRSLNGLSIAATRVLVTRGPKAARKVIGETLRAATVPGQYHAVDLFGLVRAFAVDETLVFEGDSWVDGCTAPHERFLLAQLVRFFKPKTLLEVGTYRGATTRLLLDNLPGQATLYTIDLPPRYDLAAVREATNEHLIRNREVGAEYRGHAKAHSVIQILGNTFDSSTWQQVPEGIEFAFIDASHSYEAVRNDTEMVRSKCAAGAIVVWHDYWEGDPHKPGEYGVGKYIREQMRVREDVFIALGTTLGIQIPVSALLEAEKCIARFFPSGDYFARCPQGAFPWLHRSGK
jgi:predicted O-methyltransferase YrrM